MNQEYSDVFPAETNNGSPAWKAESMLGKPNVTDVEEQNAPELSDSGREMEQVDEEDNTVDIRQLEYRVMAKIGLGQNYRWFNGSGSCEYIRRSAVDNLPNALQELRNQGHKVAPTSQLLMDTVRRIANSYESSRYSLTNTWQALSYVISEHLEQGLETDPLVRERAFQSLNDYLIDTFQRKFMDQQHQKEVVVATREQRVSEMMRQVDLTGLSYQEQQLVRDYCHAHVDHPDDFMKSAQEMIDFLKNPGDYRPTVFAAQSAYCDFVVRPSGKFKWPREIDPSEIDEKRMKNLRVEVGFGYSSTLGGNAAIKYTFADVLNEEDNTWETMSSGGVAFSLSDWVEKKTQE